MSAGNGSENMAGKKKITNCEACDNYEYDYDMGCWICSMELDEDEMYHFINNDFSHCPYFQIKDEYRIVRKQN